MPIFPHYFYKNLYIHNSVFKNSSFYYELHAPQRHREKEIAQRAKKEDSCREGVTRDVAPHAPQRHREKEIAQRAKKEDSCRGPVHQHR
jgi:hypothetical protein